MKKFLWRLEGCLQIDEYLQWELAIGNLKKHVEMMRMWIEVAR